jgi:hypothetical protein
VSAFPSLTHEKDLAEAIALAAPHMELHDPGVFTAWDATTNVLTVTIGGERDNVGGVEVQGLLSHRVMARVDRNGVRLTLAMAGRLDEVFAAGKPEAIAIERILGRQVFVFARGAAVAALKGDPLGQPTGTFEHLSPGTRELLEERRWQLHDDIWYRHNCDPGYPLSIARGLATDPRFSQLGKRILEQGPMRVTRISPASWNKGVRPGNEKVAVMEVVTIRPEDLPGMVCVAKPSFGRDG